MANVPKNTRPSFQTLFEQLANKALLKKIKNLEEELNKKETVGSLAPNNGQIATGKRKKADDGEISAFSFEEEMKTALNGMMKKLTEIDQRAITRSELIESKLGEINGNVKKVGSEIISNTNIVHDSLGTKLNAVDKIVNICSMKLDKNDVAIDIMVSNRVLIT